MNCFVQYPIFFILKHTMERQGSSAVQLTGEEFEEIRNDFIEIDKDGDGILTNQEIREFLREENEDRSDEDIEYMMKIMGFNESTTIQFLEFLELSAFFDYNKSSYKKQVNQMFKAIDKNDSGFISALEIKRLWHVFANDNTNVPSEQEISIIIESLDRNGDGKVNYNDFMRKFDSVDLHRRS